jgi:hypothetical protein
MMTAGSRESRKHSRGAGGRDAYGGSCRMTPFIWCRTRLILS